MNRRHIIIIVLILIIGLLIFSINSKEETPHESPKIRTIIQNSFFLGKFKPKEIVNIQPNISGIIDSIYVSIGDKVQIGDSIALLKIIPSPQILQNANREYRLTNTDFRQKKTNYKRDSILFSKGVIAKGDFENSKLLFDLALIELNAAINNLGIAKNGFASKAGNSPNIIKSTISGSVINISVEKGVSVTERNTFNEGNTIATIANTSSFIFHFEVGEVEINKIEVGNTFDINIKALGGDVVKGKVKQIKPIIGDNNRYSYLVSSIILGKAKNLRVGYSGLAEFELSRKNNILSIREKNILFRNRRAFIFLLMDNGEIKEREIEIGISDGIFTEILSGLDIQDKIKLL